MSSEHLDWITAEVRLHNDSMTAKQQSSSEQRAIYMRFVLWSNEFNLTLCHEILARIPLCTVEFALALDSICVRRIWKFTFFDSHKR